VSSRPVRRPPGAAPIRRTRTVRRASAGLSPVRAGAALAMLIAAGATYGVGASSAFDFVDLEVEGAHYTDTAAIEAVLDVARGENLFRLSTAPLAADLRTLPTVADAQVEVVLPGTLAVTLAEREPILLWAVGERRFLSDAQGFLFALAADVAPPPAELPVITDRRRVSRGLSVGATLDPVDLDAATRLGSLAPSHLGSSAASLDVTVGDEHGFVVSPGRDAWTAVFGFYTASLRRTEIIPGQVRLLRSLLAGREGSVQRVILADEGDGTYTERETPAPSDGTDP